MIHFYVLLGIAFLMIMFVVISVITQVHRRIPASIVPLAFITICAGLVITVSMLGVAKHRGYSYFDPKICAQVVWNEEERHWTCITWEEAG